MLDRPLYAIVRVGKLKATVGHAHFGRDKHRLAPAQIDDAAAHEFRLKDTPNASPATWELNRFIIFVGGAVGEDLTFPEAEKRGLFDPAIFRAALDRMIAERGIKAETIRHDAVLLQQVLLTASHQYFRYEKVSTPGSFVWRVKHDERYMKWRQSSIDFLVDQFGPNLTYAIEHLDEATPHLSGFVAPIVSKPILRRGRGHKSEPTGGEYQALDAATMFNPATISGLWDAYAAATAELGLIRPPRRVRARHIAITEFYTALEESTDKVRGLQAMLEFAMPDVARNALGLSESAARYRERAAEEVRKRLNDIREIVGPAVFAYLEHGLGKHDDDARRQAILDVQRRERELEKALTKAKETEQQLRDQIQRLQWLDRGLSPAELLKLMGASLAVGKDGVRFAFDATVRGIVRPSGGFELTRDGTTVAGRTTYELFAAVYQVPPKDAARIAARRLGDHGWALLRTWFSQGQTGIDAAALGRDLQRLYPGRKTSSDERSRESKSKALGEHKGEVEYS